MQADTEVRDRLIDSARNCFVQKGYAATSVQEIVAAARVTKGAFYYYFASKDEVLELLHDQFLESELALADELRRAGGSPAQRLRQMVADLVASIAQYRQNVRIFFQEVDHLPEVRRREIEARRRIYQAYVEEIVREGVEQGEFRPDLDTIITTLGIFGLVNYTYRWLQTDGRLSVEEVTRLLADMLLKGIVAVKEDEG
ncbi:MAG: TetR/AcrR family transcriptional regulator [Thermaerobacter sp.]|nr:TetR/AcrR family transcriptional regulator [Thermaerobacter sp.]